jgi:hypothetical protein
MNWTKLIAVLFIFIQFSCETKSKPATHAPPQYLADSVQNNAVKVYSDMELKQFWDSLCRKKGCLVGGQSNNTNNNREFGGEGCAFSIDKQWRDFLFKTDKKQLAAFLIEQIREKSKTRTHTCPYDLATKGELAVYCLQGISKVNFDDLSPEFKLVQEKHKYKQSGILAILNSKKQRTELQKLWKKKFEF